MSDYVIYVVNRLFCFQYLHLLRYFLTTKHASTLSPAFTFFPQYMLIILFILLFETHNIATIFSPYCNNIVNILRHMWKPYYESCPYGGPHCHSMLAILSSSTLWWKYADQYDYHIVTEKNRRLGTRMSVQSHIIKLT